MSNAEDIVKIGKKLEKMVSSDSTDDASASDLLNTLKKFPMTFEILQKTRIGMTVNSFRKACNTDSCVTTAKSLIKSWKKLLPDSGGSQSTPKSGSLQRSNSSISKDEDSRDSTANSDGQKSEPTPSSPTSPTRPELQHQKSFPSAPATTDAVRIKCRELLATALRTPPLIETSSDFDEVAAHVEEAIFQVFKNTEMKYKNRIRSRVANLRDSKNPHLRENVLFGIIPADRLAAMTSEEMASDDLKELRNKFTKEAIDDHQMVQQGGTKSDLFKCGRCGKRDTTYNQVQTRSADEPMTTFVLCNQCGNRWKFC